MSAQSKIPPVAANSAPVMLSGLPVYDGSRNPTKVTAFIRMVEKYFVENDAEQQRKTLLRCLTGEAGTWIEQARRSPTWSTSDGAQILEALKTHFFPENFIEWTFDRLMTLRQGKTSLAAHITAFNEVLLDLPEKNLNSEGRCAMLLLSLRPEIAADARMLMTRSYEELFDYLSHLANGVPATHWPKPTTRQYAVCVDAIAPTKMTSELALSTDDCASLSRKEINTNNNRALSNLVCFYCKKKGHLQRNCKRRQHYRRSTSASQKFSLVQSDVKSSIMQPE